MGETMLANKILLKDGKLYFTRTIVVYPNFVVIVGVNGKYEELVPWDAILQINL